MLPKPQLLGLRKSVHRNSMNVLMCIKILYVIWFGAEDSTPPTEYLQNLFGAYFDQIASVFKVKLTG